MLYLEHKPAPPLSRFVRVFWYVQASQFDHRRERIVPNGCAQIILNLSREFLLDCPEEGPDRIVAPALLVGQRSVYETIDTSDLADLIGIVFKPAALPVFVSDRADLFSNGNLALDQLWSGEAHVLRDCLREVTCPSERIRILEKFLLSRFTLRMERFAVHPAVEFALHQFQRPDALTVSEVARNTGWSERRFSQIFREQVGFAPKTWYRVQRFQRALRLLRSGAKIRWAEAAASCGYYDQAHFGNEFRAFSGIDATTYTATNHRLWTNHVRTGQSSA